MYLICALEPCSGILVLWSLAPEINLYYESEKFVSLAQDRSIAPVNQLFTRMASLNELKKIYISEAVGISIYP